MGAYTYPIAVGILVSALFAATAHAQGTAKVARVGYVANTMPSDANRKPEGASPFLKGLEERGWIPGKTVEVHWRSAAGDFKRRPELIAELLRARVDVLVVLGNPALQDALRLTRTTPIVAAPAYTPVEAGFVKSLARPGGNVTGIAADVGLDFYGKQLALLKEAAPQVRRVAILIPGYAYERREIIPELHPHVQEAARALGVTLLDIRFDAPGEIAAAIATAVAERADALMITDWAWFIVPANRELIHHAIARHRLPAIFSPSGHHEADPLVYGVAPADYMRRAAYFVDRILRGADPGSLPFEQPTAFRLIVNLRAAKAIGWTIPPSIIARADHVIR